MSTTLVNPYNIILFNSKIPFIRGKYKNCIGLMEPFKDGEVECIAIWVHPEISEKNKLNTTTHESIHAAYPELTEQQVIDGSDLIAEVLWKSGYRKVKSKKVKK